MKSLKVLVELSTIGDGAKQLRKDNQEEYISDLEHRLLSVNREVRLLLRELDHLADPVQPPEAETLARGLHNTLESLGRSDGYQYLIEYFDAQQLQKIRSSSKFAHETITRTIIDWCKGHNLPQIEGI